MTKKLTNLPVDSLTEIMGHLSLKNATAMGTVSKHTRTALEMVHPDRYKGPPDYTEGKGKYQKEYDAMDSILKNTLDASKAQTWRLRRSYYMHTDAFTRAQVAYESGHLVYSMTRYWKNAANMKVVYKGVLKQLKTMGDSYKLAIKALKTKQSKTHSDESQAHKVMDALVKYLSHWPG
jgi:hypothetical protein